MSGPDSQCPDYDFQVKNPPQLPPAFRNVYGNVQQTVWTQHAKNFVARNNQNGTGFDVDIENKNTASWPYRLGAPSQDPGISPLIGKWGLQILEAAGFINHEHEAGDVHMDPVGRMAKTRNPLDSPKEQIHPVLRRDMFNSTTEEDYELLKPAILLASAVLDDPTTLHFFHAVAQPAQRIADPKLGKCKIITIPVTISQAQQTAANKKIMDMRAWTSWDVRDRPDFDSHEAYAMTEPILPPNYTTSSPDTTYQTRIILSPQWLATLKDFDKAVSSGGTEYEQMLKNILDQAEVPQNRRPDNLDIVSAIMRVNLKLAATMLHEFGHAFVRAHVQGPYTDYREPWISSNRSNELGIAFETYIFGGWFHAQTIYNSTLSNKERHEQTITAPFGLHFFEPWDANRVCKAKYGELVLSKGVVHASDYPVPQRYVYKLHVEEMWKQRVPRYGLDALKLPKLVWWSTLWC